MCGECRFNLTGDGVQGWRTADISDDSGGVYVRSWELRFGSFWMARVPQGCLLKILADNSVYSFFSGLQGACVRKQTKQQRRNRDPARRTESTVSSERQPDICRRSFGSDTNGPQRAGGDDLHRLPGVGVNRKDDQWWILPISAPGDRINVNTNLWILPLDATSADHSWYLQFHGGAASATKTENGLKVHIQVDSLEITKRSRALTAIPSITNSLSRLRAGRH